MAGNSRPSFTKRQKERARQERMAEKLEKKAQKKQLVGTSDTPETQALADLVVTHDEEGQPQGFDFHDFAK